MSLGLLELALETTSVGALVSGARRRVQERLELPGDHAMAPGTSA